MRFDDAIMHCNRAMATLKNGSADQREQKGVFEKTKKTAEIAKKREDERFKSLARKKNAEEAVVVSKRNALSRRSITMGLPLFSQQRSYSQKGPLIVEDSVHWPVLLLYPEEAIGVPGIGDQSDYLEKVSENATLEELLATVFPPGESAPWDRRGLYKDFRQLEVLFREDWTYTEDEADSDDEEYFVGSMRGPEEVGAWKTIPVSSTLRQALATRGYVVPMFPVLYVVRKGTYLS